MTSEIDRNTSLQFVAGAIPNSGETVASGRITAKYVVADGVDLAELRHHLRVLLDCPPCLATSFWALVFADLSNYSLDLLLADTEMERASKIRKMLDHVARDHVESRRE